jgi:hypothetical protein
MKFSTYFAVYYNNYNNSNRSSRDYIGCSSLLGYRHSFIRMRATSVSGTQFKMPAPGTAGSRYGGLVNRWLHSVHLSSRDYRVQRVLQFVG